MLSLPLAFVAERVSVAAKREKRRPVHWRKTGRGAGSFHADRENVPAATAGPVLILYRAVLVVLAKRGRHLGRGTLQPLQQLRHVPPRFDW